MQMVRCIHCRHGDGFIDLVEHLIDAMLGAMGLRVLFGADDNPVHGLNRLNRIGTCCGFS
ncbi:hypothetical protein D3C79_962300 [compost metagenome]